MAVASPSPSPFAALLRRSKFVTYDPSIGQVFTAYGGHAYRGNWGFKRPIGVRRRGAFITVKSIDTPAQQTEWNSGEARTKWIRNWEELNFESRVSSLHYRASASAQTYQFTNSDFAPSVAGAEKGKENVRPQVVRNIHAMPPKEFKAFLEKLREKRPAFIKFLREKANVADKSLFQLAQQPQNYHVEFIAAEASKVVDSLESRAIDPIPHKTGGALYSHPSRLQTFLTTKPQPGRILADGDSRTRVPDTYIASFAGTTRRVPKKFCSGLQRMNWSNPADSRAVTRFHIAHARFWRMPRVVGRFKQGVKSIINRVWLRSIPSTPEYGRSNLHRPGSLAYVAASPPPPKGKGGKYATPVNLSAPYEPHRLKQFPPTQRSSNKQHTMALLRSLLNRDPNSTDSDPYPDDI